MSATETILLLGITVARRAALEAALDGAARLEGRPLLPDASVDPGVAAAVVVDMDADAEVGLRTIERLRAARPSLPIVALAASRDSELILRAVRAGAREFLSSDDTQAQRTTLLAIIKRERKQGTVVSCFAARGGVGATTTAVNLAAGLSGGGSRVVVLDLDLQLGDALLLLDLDGTYDISDVLSNADRLDGDLLRASLPRHGSGVWALGQSDRIEEGERIGAQDVNQLIELLRRHFDYVVIDGLRGFDERTLAALDLTDQLLLLVTQDIPSVKNGRRCIEVLRRLAYDETRIKLVVTRSRRRGAGISLEAVAEHLAVPVAASVSNDYIAVSGAIDKGRLVIAEAPRTEVARDLVALAALVAGKVSAKPRSLLRSLLSRGQPAPVG